MQISSRASFPEGEIVVTRNPYKANWQACKHGVLALWIFLSIGAVGPATDCYNLCHPQVTSLRHLFFVGRHAPLGSGTVGRLQAVTVVRFAQEGPYVVGSRREV